MRRYLDCMLLALNPPVYRVMEFEEDGDGAKMIVSIIEISDLSNAHLYFSTDSYVYYPLDKKCHIALNPADLGRKLLRCAQSHLDGDDSMYTVQLLDRNHEVVHTRYRVRWDEEMYEADYIKYRGVFYEKPDFDDAIISFSERIDPERNVIVWED